jgi:hypothetical protein
VWAAANAYNARHKQPRQHWGPLTKSYMLALKALLWRFHGADGGGRCFPSFERIVAAVNISRDTAIEAVKAFEAAGLLTWVNRITRIRRRERDLFGQFVTAWQVIRTSNAYRFIDPLDREPDRKGYESENPTRPQNQDLNSEGARLDGAQVMQEKSSLAAPAPPDRPAIAPQREHGGAVRGRLSPTERAAILARQDAGGATRADWAAWDREVATMVQARSCAV